MQHHRLLNETKALLVKHSHVQWKSFIFIHQTNEGYLMILFWSTKNEIYPNRFCCLTASSVFFCLFIFVCLSLWSLFFPMVESSILRKASLQARGFTSGRAMAPQVLYRPCQFAFAVAVNGMIKTSSRSPWTVRKAVWSCIFNAPERRLPSRAWSATSPCTQLSICTAVVRSWRLFNILYSRFRDVIPQPFPTETAFFLNRLLDISHLRAAVRV